MNIYQAQKMKNSLLRSTEMYAHIQNTYDDNYLDEDIYYTSLALKPGANGVEGFIDDQFTDGLKKHLEILKLVKSDKVFSEDKTKLLQ